MWTDFNVTTDEKEDECADGWNERNTQGKHLRAAKSTDNAAQHDGKNQCERENNHDV